MRRSKAGFNIIVALVLTLSLAMPAIAAAQTTFKGPVEIEGNYSESNPGAVRSTLQQYGAATWQSFLAMTYPDTGLPVDNINAVTHERSGYTSPTNIGAYIWSTLVARDTQLINPQEARNRIAVTLATLSRMERGSGTYTGADIATGQPVQRHYSFFYNW